MENPAIIVVTYNRFNSLKRLLKSINNAYYKQLEKTPLIISIDKTDVSEIYQIAENFEWPGQKLIIKHKVKLGLKEHILSCGDLTKKYGEVIILEDDLFVGPYFYNYAQKALDYYKKSDKIAGISLYGYKYLENFDLLFHPYKTDFDSYFIQYASSWGQAWTNIQWKAFKKWYANNKKWDKEDKRIPQFVHKWAESSWKKYFIRYLIDEDRFFVYPYNSYTTNFGEIGTNEGYKNSLHQVNLTQGNKINFANYDFNYDAYFQINPDFLKTHNKELDNYEFDVDFFGNKPYEICNKKYILTTRQCNKPILSFGMELYPVELNVIHNISGNDIYLTKKEDADFNLNGGYKLIKYSYQLSDKAIAKIQRQLPPLRKQLTNQLLYKFKKIFRK